MCLTKICIKCNENKNIDLFVKRSSLKSGYDSICKKCKADIKKEDYKNNPQKYINSSSEFYYNNKEEISQKNKEKYSKNKLKNHLKKV